MSATICHPTTSTHRRHTSPANAAHTLPSVPPPIQLPPFPEFASIASSSMDPQRGENRRMAKKSLTIHTSLPCSNPSSDDEGAQRKIRALPQVPDPAHSLPGTRPPTLRPLPQTPGASPSSATQFNNPGLSPASATSSATPMSSAPPTPSVPAHALPRRTDSLRARGVPALLVPPRIAESDDVAGPLSPVIVPPSPATRHKRNVFKLARHLGDDLPTDLVRARRMTPLVHMHGIDLQKCSESDSDRAADGEAADKISTLPTVLDNAGRKKQRVRSSANRLGVVQIDDKRYSTHWFREKAGKRMEKDYNAVLSGLRKL